MSFVSKSWAVEKEMIQCFDIKTTNTNRLSVSKNLCLNFCSLKWLKPTRRRVIRISPFGWLTLKTSLQWGLIKLKVFFLKVEYKGDLRISEFNSLHLTNAHAKKSSNNNNNVEIAKFLPFLVCYELLFEGIKSNILRTVL